MADRLKQGASSSGLWQPCAGSEVDGSARGCNLHICIQQPWLPRPTPTPFFPVLASFLERILEGSGLIEMLKKFKINKS